MELLQSHPAVVLITAAIQEWLWNVPWRGMWSLGRWVCSSLSYWGFPAASLARDAFTASQTLPWPLAPALYSSPALLLAVPMFSSLQATLEQWGAAPGLHGFSI